MRQFEKGDDRTRKRIYDLYRQEHSIRKQLGPGGRIGAPYRRRVSGGEGPRNSCSISPESSNLWERRIAIIATYWFIKRDDFTWTIRVAGILLNDSEDLIHKAVGWMLREVGNRDRAEEEKFLERHYARMPRTMLRYAIEKFPERRRQAYLKGRI